MNKLRQEVEKIKALPKDQRWDYYKTYYFIPTIILILSLVLCGWLITDVISNHRKVLISGLALNVELSEEAEDFLSSRYFTYRNGKKRTEQVLLNAGYFVDFEGKNPQEQGDKVESVLYAQIAVGDYDYILMDRASLERLNHFNAYQDLEEILTPEQIERFRDDFVYLYPIGDDTKKVAVAIDLSDSEFVKQYKPNPSEIYLTVVCSMKDQERIQTFLDYATQPSN